MKEVHEINTSIKAGYTLTEAGVVPADWAVSTVKEEFEICNNLRLPISEKVRKEMQGEYPYYGPTKIQDYINDYRVEGEYSLIGEDGDHFLKWNEMPMTLLVKGKFNVNNHAHLVKGTKNLTSWFYYYFRNKDITKHLTRQGAGRYKLSKRSLEEIPVALPKSKDEQKSIINVLTDAEVFITTLERLIAKKRDLKQGVVQLLLKAKKDWRLKRLGDILEYEQPTKYLVATTDYNDNNKTPVLTAGKTFVLGYTDEEFGIYTNVPVIIFDDFTTASKYVTFPFKAKSSAMKMLSLKDKSQNLKFVFELMQKIDFPLGDHKRHWIGEYQEIEVLVPEKDEQDKIAEIISDMDVEIETLLLKLNKYKMLRQGVMQQLLTGKARLVNPNPQV